MSGSTPELGSWDAKKALVLGNTAHPQWVGEVPIGTDTVVEYKYLIVDTNGNPVTWEVRTSNVRLLEALPSFF